MWHKKGGFKLSRNLSHRRALLRNLVTSLFEREEIRTTSIKAKALRPLAEKLITLAKRGDLSARRLAGTYIFGKQVLHKLFAEIAPNFKDRHGGYLRILKLGNRPGDGAELSLVQLIMEKKKEDEKSTADLKAKKKEDKKHKQEAKEKRNKDKAELAKTREREAAKATATKMSAMKSSKVAAKTNVGQKKGQSGSKGG